MIILSRNLVLNQPAAADADNPVIGWRNLATPTNIAADTAQANYPASNLANVATYLKWIAANTTQQHLTITLNSINAQDYIAVAKHNWGSAQIPVTVQHFVNPTWVDLVPETLLPDDAPALFRFEPTALTQIRFRLKPGSAPPQAGVVYCGALTVLPRKVGVGHTPAPYGRRPNIVNGLSENGEYLGSIQVGSTRRNSLQLQNLVPLWYRQNLDPMIAARLPFFFAWRPQSWPLEVGFSWFANTPKPVNQRPNGMMAIDLELEGVA